MRKGSTRSAQEWAVMLMQAAQRALEIKREQLAKEYRCKPDEVLDELLFPVLLSIDPTPRGKATRILQEVNLAKKQEGPARSALGLIPFESWVLRSTPSESDPELFTFQLERPTGRISRRGHMMDMAMDFMMKIEETAVPDQQEDLLDKYMRGD